MIDFEGKTLKTTQDPYIDGVSGERPHYKATAVDAENNEYILVWDVYDEYEEITDESEMCDWYNPIGVTLVK
ncbi:hypothetical protein GRF59_15015 [Paenibacillus sp. HJL G12]|uniref:Uncharacterized protein n=1 Tax=Paenibacillus dendrobii TaxID=2691084 RepID=A0A7X3LGN1_9BACL|nr:hypothetical protein [Paenibacillus dendrobii]